MNDAGALSVTAPTDREIVLTRAFDAPRRLVFDAWTRPELLRRWYGARGWNLVVCEVDLRAGGRWRFVSRGPGGQEMGQGGVYRVVSPPDRLVCTEVFDDQSYPGETLVTHEFAERDGRTTLTSTVLYATREGRDIVLAYPMARGVAEGYDRLAEMLAELPVRAGNRPSGHDDPGPGTGDQDMTTPGPVPARGPRRES